MKRTLSFAAFGNATSLFLAITFSTCVAFDLLFPAHAMYQAWQRLLPGFEWISWKSFSWVWSRVMGTAGTQP